MKLIKLKKNTIQKKHYKNGLPIIEMSNTIIKLQNASATFTDVYTGLG